MMAPLDRPGGASATRDPVHPGRSGPPCRAPGAVVKLRAAGPCPSLAAGGEAP